MKIIIRISLLLLALLLLSGCVSVPLAQEGLVIGDSYRLESGETLSHDLTVVGGNATLDEDSTVNGDVAVLGGNVTIDGTVNGDISVLGGYVYLDNHALVKGSVNSLGGTVQRSSQAVVEGRDLGNNNRPPRITTMRAPNMQVSIDPITAPLMAIFQGLALAALAVLAALFIAAPLDRTGRAAMITPFASGGVGCLTILVLLIMAVTIILLPVSFLGFLVVGIAALFGWLALGLMVGRQLAVWLKQPWTDPVSAGVGTLTISLLASLLNVIPCIGWTVSAVAGLVALGAVILTRFGTQIYPSPYGAAPAPRPGPYTPPPGPVINPESVSGPGARAYETPERDEPDEYPPTRPQDNA